MINVINEMTKWTTDGMSININQFYIIYQEDECASSCMYLFMGTFIYLGISAFIYGSECVFMQIWIF